MIDIDINRLFTEDKRLEMSRIKDIIHNSSQKGVDIAIRSAPLPRDKPGGVEKGKESGPNNPRVSERIATFFGEIAAHIIKEIEINGILLTGGDIAVRTANCLGITGTVIENEIVPGIPYGHFADEEYKNVTIVTKAGGFGGDDAIFQVLKFLNKRAGE